MKSRIKMTHWIDAASYWTHGNIRNTFQYTKSNVCILFSIFDNCETWKESERLLLRIIFRLIVFFPHGSHSWMYDSGEQKYNRQNTINFGIKLFGLLNLLYSTTTHKIEFQKKTTSPNRRRNLYITMWLAVCLAYSKRKWALGDRRLVPIAITPSKHSNWMNNKNTFYRMGQWTRGRQKKKWTTKTTNINS